MRPQRQQNGSSFKDETTPNNESTGIIRQTVIKLEFLQDIFRIVQIKPYVIQYGYRFRIRFEK